MRSVILWRDFETVIADNTKIWEESEFIHTEGGM